MMDVHLALIALVANRIDHRELVELEYLALREPETLARALNALPFEEQCCALDRLAARADVGGASGGQVTAEQLYADLLPASYLVCAGLIRHSALLADEGVRQYLCGAMAEIHRRRAAGLARLRETLAAGSDAPPTLAELLEQQASVDAGYAEWAAGLARREELKLLTCERRDIEVRIATFRQTLHDATNFDFDGARACLVTLQTDLARAQAEQQDLAAELEAAHRAVQVAAEEHARLREQLTQEQYVDAELRKQAATAVAQIRELEGGREQLLTEIARANEEIRAAQERHTHEVADYESRKEELARHHAANERIVRALQHAAGDQTAQAQSEEGSIHTLLDTVADLLKRSDEAAQELIRLKQDRQRQPRLFF